MEDYEEFVVDSVVRGHHVYKDVWTPYTGEELTIAAEESNSHDQYAMAILKATLVVGHVPRNLSRVFYFFMRHGGTIECTVTGHRKFGIGLEVSCSYKLSGKPKDLLNC